MPFVMVNYFKTVSSNDCRKKQTKFIVRNFSESLRARISLAPTKKAHVINCDCNDYGLKWCNGSYAEPPFLSVMTFISSIGKGKMIVEFLSTEIAIKVCRYRSWRAMGFLDRMSDASARRVDA